MILTGPKENYCFVEVSREIKGGAQFLGQLEGVAAHILGREVVAHVTEIELELDASTNQLLTERSARPVTRPAGCEIPPPNELHLPLLHRGFESDSKKATRYPDTAHVKSRLKHKKVGLRDKFAAVALKYDQELEGAGVWFDRAEYLPSPGRSLILGLRPKSGDATTQVLEEQALVASHELRSISKLLYQEAQPWNLAMAVARVEIAAEADEAKWLLDNIGSRLPVRMQIGGIRYLSDDISKA